MYILGFVDSHLQRNEPSKRTPFCWKSYKLPRVVSLTLGAEAQSSSTACAIAEWMAMVTEARLGSFDLRTVSAMPKAPIISNVKPETRSITGITDCKLFLDHLTAMTSASKVEDKRVASDLAILKQYMAHWSFSKMVSYGTYDC